MPVLELEKPKVFRDVKEAPMLLLLIVLLSDMAFNWLYVNFLSAAFSIPGVYTGGLVDSLFVLSIMKLAFIGLGITVWIGGFRGQHLGLEKGKYKYGILTTFFVWALLQFIQIGYGMINANADLGYMSTLTQNGPVNVIGGFFLYALGKAFFDELTYRSLLLPQLHLKCRRYINLDDRVTLAIAIVISQSIYLILQLPLINLLMPTNITTAMTLTSLFFLSILNSLIYLRTKNLYITIGLHALWYHPIFVATPSIPHSFVLVILAIGFILIWPMLPNSPSLMSTWPLEKERS